MDLIALVTRKEVILERGVVALMKIHKVYDLDCEDDLKELRAQFNEQQRLERAFTRTVIVGEHEYCYKYIKAVKALGLHPKYLRKELDPRDVDAWIKERLVALT
nr:MAG TPA: hypothetical protein [Caudoviricetes sp.]